MISTAITLITVALLLGLFITTILAKWMMFEKMGEKGWKSLIPVYDVYKLFDKVWTKKAFLAIILLEIASNLTVYLAKSCTGIVLVSVYGSAIACGIAIIVMSLIFSNKLAKAFGHGKGFTILGFFCEPIATMIYGFGKDEYLGAAC